MATIKTRRLKKKLEKSDRLTKYFFLDAEWDDLQSMYVIFNHDDPRDKMTLTVEEFDVLSRASEIFAMPIIITRGMRKEDPEE